MHSMQTTVEGSMEAVEDAVRQRRSVPRASAS